MRRALCERRFRRRHLDLRERSASTARWIPGETVTVILRLRDEGNVSTRNLVATLLATNGVLPVPPNNPQTYGILSPSGFPVGRPFSFTASGTNGGAVSPPAPASGRHQHLPARELHLHAAQHVYESPIPTSLSFLIRPPRIRSTPCSLAPPSRIPRPSAYPTSRGCSAR